jgi:histidyl-tRNA synthetase
MAEKSKKPQKLRARLPRGLADRGPAEIAATRRMTETIREVFERYGFEPVETPAMEFTDALGKFLPDQDRPNEGVFSFQDDDEQWISLRYDLTAPLARYVAENFDSLAKPYRSYRAGYVYRNEKPGPGRFRQFMQFDADTVGSASPAADAEMCMMAADTLEAVGLKRGKYVIKLNSRKVLDGVMEAIGLDGADKAGQRLTVLRAIDKLDRLGWEGVRALLGPGRKDESGDFTNGAGLTPEQIASIQKYFGLNEVWALANAKDSKNFDTDQTLSKSELKTSLFDDELKDQDKNPGRYFDNMAVLEMFSEAVASSTTGQEGVRELQQIVELVRASGYGSLRIRIDPSVVRGLEYYTGPVFEAEYAFDIKAEDGRVVRVGSVGGGGRYDGLVSRFRGEPVPATGFSIGVSRLLASIAYSGHISYSYFDKQPGPVVVTVFDKDRIADYQKMVATLRNALLDPTKPNGPRIRAELYLGNPKNMGNQLKYADKRNSPCVIIQGSDEKANGKIQIKDLILGAGLTEIKDREEYLKKQTEAQYEVDEGRLVEAVREVLARHEVKWN